MLCKRRLFHSWGTWRPGAVINIVGGIDRHTKTAMWNQCEHCGWIKTKEVYGTYKEVTN